MLHLQLRVIEFHKEKSVVKLALQDTEARLLSLGSFSRQVHTHTLLLVYVLLVSLK